MKRRQQKSSLEKYSRIGPGLRSSGPVVYSPVPTADNLGLHPVATSGDYDDLENTPSESEFLPRDTYEDETFTIPEFRQLVLGGTVTLLGSATLDVQGTLVLI